MLYILTEERSAKHVITAILLAAGYSNTDFEVLSHEKKNDLLIGIRKKVSGLLRPAENKVIIVHDQDSSDCVLLKSKLIKELPTQLMHDGRIKVCIVCKELEAWYFGDLTALSQVYNRFKPSTIQNQHWMRDVDAIDQPSKRILQEIPELLSQKKLPKIAIAESFSQHLNLQRNTSSSFQHFVKVVTAVTS